MHWITDCDVIWRKLQSLEYVANQGVRHLSFVFSVKGSTVTLIVIGSEKWQGPREYGAGIK